MTTFAGSTKGKQDGTIDSCQFDLPTGITFHNSAIYVCDRGNNLIRKILDGISISFFLFKIVIYCVGLLLMLY